MKKILTIIAALLIWGSIMILCGEKAEDASWTSFYIGKAVAFVTLAVSSFWLDRNEWKKANQ